MRIQRPESRGQTRLRERAFSWLLGSFLFGALVGGLLLVGFVLFGEVAAVAVRFEPEDGRLGNGWMRFCPSFGVGAVLGEVGAEFLETGFFREVEIAQGNQGGEACGVGGVAFCETVGVRGDFGDLNGASVGGEALGDGAGAGSV